MVFFRSHRLIPAAALLLAGGLALAPPARATTLRRVEVTCPVDGERFFARTVISTNSVGTDRDLFRRTSGLHAGKVIIWTCPGNYYSGYAKDFRIRLGEDLKRRIREELRPLIKGVPAAALPAWARYELAGRIYEWHEQPPEAIAWTYLRATHFLKNFRRSGDPGGGRTSSLAGLRARAAGWFAKAFEDKETNEKNLVHIAYIAGELLRRAGKFGEAITWLDRAASLSKGASPEFRLWIAEQRSLAAAKNACECDGGPEGR